MDNDPPEIFTHTERGGGKGRTFRLEVIRVFSSCRAALLSGCARLPGTRQLLQVSRPHYDSLGVCYIHTVTDLCGLSESGARLTATSLQPGARGGKARRRSPRGRSPSAKQWLAGVVRSSVRSTSRREQRCREVCAGKKAAPHNVPASHWRRRLSG